MLFQGSGLIDAERFFDYDYIYFDGIFLVGWLFWLIKTKRYSAIKAGLVFGLLTFFIDSVVWWNLPAGGSFPPDIYVREYWIGADQVPHQFGEILLLKLGADFMMTISYGLFAFTWVWLMFGYWKGQISKKEIVHLTEYWILSWVLIPWLSIWIPWNDITVHSVRHMESQFVIWIINLIIGYIFLTVIACSGKFGQKEPRRKVLHVFIMGMFVAFMMEFPLFISGIRPVNLLFLLYETIFLFNQGAPYLWVMSERLFPYFTKHLNIK
jgi:hypothetical protein